jgi:lipopolysaccharide export system permease protein
MSILDRYITREFSKLFSLVIATFLSLYLVIDFFEKIRMFSSNNATFSQMGRFFLFSFPMIASQSLPIAVLVASLLTFGLMSRNNEITAMKANGISIYRVSIPILILSMIVCIMTFLMNEFVTPHTNRIAEYIRLVEIQKQKKLGAFKQNQIWYKSKNAIYNFKTFDPEKNIIQGISISYLDDDYGVSKRIDARDASWKDHKWEFKNLLITTFPKGQVPVVVKVSAMLIDLPEEPADFLIVQRDTETMGFLELRDYIRKIKSEGYEATRYEVDLQGKIAFALVSIIVAMLGVSFSVRWGKSGGIAQGIGMGIIIAFSYWIVYAFSMSLGRSGTLSPLIAAWSANVLFGLIAGYSFLQAKT